MNVRPLQMLVWNVRGLNAPARRDVVRQVVLGANPGIVCLQETKLQEISAVVVQCCLGNKCTKFFYVPAVGMRGGILVAWDETIVKLSNPHYQSNSLTTIVEAT